MCVRWNVYNVGGNDTMKYINILITFALLLCLCSSTYGFYSGENINITTVKCEGQLMAKLRTKFNSTFSINDCSFKDGFWYCDCITGKDFTVRLNTSNNTNDNVDLVIQYYLKANNPDWRRTKNFNNLEIYPKGKEPVSLFPNIGSTGLIYLLIFAIIALGASIFGIYYVIKLLRKDDDEDEVKLTQKDIDEYLGKGAK